MGRPRECGTGPGRSRTPSCGAPSEGALDLLGEVAEHRVLVLGLVARLVLVDAHVRLAGVAVLVERDRPGEALVVDVLSVVDELRAVGEVVALRAALRDLLEVVAD